MIYLVDELIADFRSDVFDRPDVDGSGEPRDTLWSDEDVLRYANAAACQWAADTLAMRANLTLNVTPGKNTYYTGQEIIEIVRAAIFFPPANTRPRQLAVFNMESGYIKDDYGLTYIYPVNLENDTGPARGITRDYDPRSLRLYPTPIDTATVHINAVVKPQQIFCGMPMPSSDFQDRHLFLAWMKHLAYRKQDADVLDLSRADSFLADYREMVRVRRSDVDRNIRDDRIMVSRW